MNEIRPYPYIILRLNCVSGFIDAVYEAMPAFDTQLEAYESVERTHEYYFGKRRYEDYLYFLSARSKYYHRISKHRPRQ